MIFRLYFMLMFCFALVLSFEDFNILRLQRRTETRKTSPEFPNNTDVTEYLDALSRVVNFCNDHKNDIDINFYFGLFLANVNLQRVYRNKYQTLPGNIRVNIVKIVSKLDELSEFFTSMVGQDQNVQDYEYKKIFSLFAEPLAWLDILPPFHEDMLPSDREEAFIKKILASLRVEDFNNVYAWVPTPVQSNMCLGDLATSVKKNYGNLQQCKVLGECRNILKFGTDFGYALAHRLLFLQLAKYSRRCNIFSEEEDKKIAERLCAIAYQEAEYILDHNFTNVDIIIEHVTLCSLDGHAQFLQRPWLQHFLLFQTVHGCFTEEIQKIMDPPTLPEHTTPKLWKLENQQNHRLLGGACNGHTTALAAGTLATAVRFVLDPH